MYIDFSVTERNGECMFTYLLIYKRTEVKWSEVVLQSLSKAFGLAAIHLGMALFASEDIKQNNFNSFTMSRLLIILYNIILYYIIYLYLIISMVAILN
jgi:hypothetical protein